MERSEIRERPFPVAPPVPHCAALHAGYFVTVTKYW